MTVSDYARILLSIAVWRESRSVPAAWTGVAWVALNRALEFARRFQVDMNAALVHVLSQPYQFSSMGAPGDHQLTLWPTPGVLWDSLCDAVSRCLDGTTADPTNGAIFYFSLPLTSPPAEWGQVEKTFIAGDIQFWRPVR